jgi:septal ring-binding cell division protein DamX
VGILVLLLLIVGIGSALKSPSSSSQQTASGEKSINLSDDQSASTPAAGQDQTRKQHLTAGCFSAAYPRTRLRARQRLRRRPAAC